MLKFAAQAITKVAELGWTPLHILNSVSGSVGAVLKPAGFQNAKGFLPLPISRTQLIPPGKAIRPSFNGQPLWTNIFQMAIALSLLRSMATRLRKRSSMSFNMRRRS